MHELLEKTRRGRLRIIFQHEGLEERFAQAESAINRMSVGVIVAGIIIGSAIVLAGGQAVGLGNFRTEGIIGYAVPVTVAIAGLGMSVALLIGLWVIWGVVRMRRQPPPDEPDDL